MNFSEYQINVTRSLAELGSYERNVAHMKAGIFTEFGELVDAYKRTLAYGKALDNVNVSEEIADIAFYCSGLAWINSVPLRDIDMEHSHFVENILSFDAWGEYSPENAIAALMVMYDTFYNNIDDYTFLTTALLLFSTWAGVDLYKALDNNIAKLKARYPEKFDAGKALNRDLKTERAALEA